ncbi:MAG: hypothetical protein L7F78_24615, partial [Syntrophales bacterium LBB04]|nr:hypothetical protein [Syntrophales bacterium LBB04]
MSGGFRWKKMSPSHNISLREYLEAKKKITNDALEMYLPSEESYPPFMFKAVRYSVFAGGKRIRP